MPHYAVIGKTESLELQASELMGHGILTDGCAPPLNDTVVDTNLKNGGAVCDQLHVS